MMNKFLWIAAFACSLVLGQNASANVCREGLAMMVNTLHLDQSQKEKIKPVLEQLKSTMQENRKQMKEVRMELTKQAHSENMDQSTVDGLVDKQTKLIGDNMKARINAKHQIFMSLNPQQRAQIQSRMEKMEEKVSAMYKKCHDED
jgi:protein CpxP